MLLPLLILIPFIGGFLCWQLESLNKKIPRLTAFISISIVLFLSVYIWINNIYYTSNIKLINNFQYKFYQPWITSFGISFYLFIDGLSLMMIIMTSLLGFISILCSWKEIKKNCGLFYLNLMFILGSVIGAFLSFDLFLFFFFWEIMTIPIYFLICLWGYKSHRMQTRVFVANKFFLYTQFSSIIMLISILSLAFMYKQIHGIWTFNYDLLLKLSMPSYIEYMIMLGFFIAFAIKIPLVPLHGWLPDVHCNTINSGAVDLTGILLKIAIYGFLRFNLALFPTTSNEFSFIPIFLGIITIFYGAVLAFGQNDIKRLIAYSSISHMGFIIIAIYSANKLALQGVIVQMIAHSLSTAALFILCGLLHDRLKTRDMRNMGGIWNKLSWLPGMMLFFSAANLGLPGTGNFIGEFMILNGSFQKSPVLLFIATLSLVLSSIYSLFMIQKTFYGPYLLKTKMKPFKKIAILDMFSIMILISFNLFIGFYPQIILDTTYNSIDNIYQNLLIKN